MKIQFKYLLLATWLILIFILSNQVANESSLQSAVIVDFIKNSLHISLSESILTFLTRKSAHIFMYFVLGILMYNVVKEYGFGAKKAILLSILFSLSYAGIDEAHQLFVQGRSGEVADVLIDATAASFGIFAHYYIAKIRSARLVTKHDEK